MIRLSLRQQLWGLLAFAYGVRLLTIGGYPLTDTTEARYGEIARKMLETGQWIVPQIDYGVPFWGKPPLSFWLTALSYKLIGVTEFAARIPSLLLGVATCVLVYVLAHPRGRDFALRATVIVATSALMMMSAGTVMTDPAMLLGTTLAMVAFWRALTTGSRSWGYAFFIGLAIGLLAKGPVAAVLSLGPIGAWALFTGRWRQLGCALPWITGTALTALLVVPWYWAAEAQSPGFLHYFLIGEHWQRFTVSGWKGDLYGSGHPYPLGTIWVFALLGTLPWSPWWLWRLSRREGRLSVAALRANEGWLLYLLCWMLAPLLLFTMSRNILPTYFLPGLVGFGLLTAEAWQVRASVAPRGRLAGLGLVMPVALAAVVLLIWPAVGFQSQKALLAAYQQDQAAQPPPLVYYRQRPYSAEFYSRGRAQRIDDLATLEAHLAQPSLQYVATASDTFRGMPEHLRQHLQQVMTAGDGHYLLLRHNSAEWIHSGAQASSMPPRPQRTTH